MLAFLRHAVDLSVKIISNQRECPICFDVKSRSLFYKTPCCRTRVCIICYKHWVNARLDAPIRKITLICPIDTCKRPLTEDFLQRTFDEEQTQKWMDIQTKLSLMNDPSYFFCPKCPSGGYLQLDGLVNNQSCREEVLRGRFQLHVINSTVLYYFLWNYWVYWIPGLGGIAAWYVYCKQLIACFEDMTKAERLEDILRYGTCVECPDCHEKWSLEPKASDESVASTTEWINQRSKPCPNCKSPIEKNGGCHHMTCSNCRFEFCWECQGEFQNYGHICDQQTLERVQVDHQRRSGQLETDETSQCMNIVSRFALPMVIAHFLTPALGIIKNAILPTSLSPISSLIFGAIEHVALFSVYDINSLQG